MVTGNNGVNGQWIWDPAADLAVGRSRADAREIRNANANIREWEIAYNKRGKQIEELTARINRDLVTIKRLNANENARSRQVSVLHNLAKGAIGILKRLGEKLPDDAYLIEDSGKFFSDGTPKTNHRVDVYEKEYAKECEKKGVSVDL